MHFQPPSKTCRQAYLPERSIFRNTTYIQKSRGIPQRQIWHPALLKFWFLKRDNAKRRKKNPKFELNDEFKGIIHQPVLWLIENVKPQIISFPAN
jgi:hypothetical protein